MADGSLKAIADVRIGDRVQAIDPMTGRPVIGTVTATYRNQDQQFADLTLLGADGKVRQLETTQHHRFWDVTRQAWVFALDLAVGDQLQAADGSVVTVESVSTYQGSQVMYDITVDPAHDFYVVVSATSVLVHNCDGLAPGDVGRFGDLDKQAVRGDSLTPHHVPQAALGFTSREDGAAIVMEQADHVLTRTYLSKGAVTAVNEAGLPFRTVLARDLWDLRGIDRGLWQAAVSKIPAYYRQNFPELILKL